MQVLYPVCCGLDVHQKVVVGCLRSVKPEQEQSLVSQEIKEFSTTVSGLKELARWLEENDCPVVGMESTGVYWKPIYYILSRTVKVVVGNPADMKQLSGKKTDKSDAKWISDLLAHGLIKDSFIPSPEIQALRDLTRTRATLVQTRAQAKNRVHKLLECTNIKMSSVVSDIFGKSGRDMLASLIAGQDDSKALAQKARGRLKKKIPDLELALEGNFTSHHGTLIKMLLEQIDLFTKHIDDLDKAIDESLLPYESQVELLMSIPGIKKTSSGVIIAEIGPDMLRYGSPERLSSWGGVCPGNNESAGKRKSGKIRKGNKWLKRTLIECAWSVTKMDNFLGLTMRRLKARIGKKKAAVAVAHKMVVIMYCMLLNGELYDESRYDHFQQQMEARNKKRALKTLEKLGYKVTLENTDAAELAAA